MVYSSDGVRAPPTSTPTTQAATASQVLDGTTGPDGLRDVPRWSA
jgi:hypothetical protein